MKRMKEYGGQATCTQLSIKYGESANFYNSGSSALARRVAKKQAAKSVREITGMNAGGRSCISEDLPAAMMMEVTFGNSGTNCLLPLTGLT